MSDLARFERFIKMMQLTQSESDGECLVAIRKANGILAELNIDWEQLLRAKVKIKSVSGEVGHSKDKGRKYGFNPKYDKYKRHTDANEINTMVHAILGRTPRDTAFYGFIVSVKEYFDTEGFITHRQYEALEKAYNRSTRY